MVIRNLSKVYGNNEVLDNVNLVFDKGLNLIIGPNGSGKTTLLEIIEGNRKATSGEVILDNKKISCLFQENSLRRNVTLNTEINLYKSIYKTDSEYINYLVDKLQLEEYLNVASQNLSIGTQRRALCLLTLLDKNSEILILDEPTSGLDINSRSLIWNLLYDISKQKIVIITDHYLSEAKKYIDTITIINKGKIIISDNLGQVVNNFPYKYIKNNKYLVEYETGGLEINVEDIYACYLNGGPNVH